MNLLKHDKQMLAIIRNSVTIKSLNKKEGAIDYRPKKIKLRTMC